MKTLTASLPAADRRATRGVTSVLAMLYLVLFSTLAIGFFAATTSQTQIVNNDANIVHASAAAETGMDFMRYYLAQVVVPPLTSLDDLMAEVHGDLSTMLNPTANMRGATVYLSPDETVIEVPGGANNYVELTTNGPRFRATITRNGPDLIVRTTGVCGSTAAAGGSVGSKMGGEMIFRAEQLPGTFFKYGLASKGAILVDASRVLRGDPDELASVLSALDAVNPVMIGNNNPATPGGIEGEITLLQGRNPTIRPGATVEGSIDPLTIQNNSIHHITPDEVPDFPTPDTSIFRQYVDGPYVAGQAVYENIIIPPFTNPIFDAGKIVRGVVYIQQPNTVTFNGNVTINGIIVTEDVGAGTLGNNRILFQGNGGAKTTVDSLPPDPKFDGLRELTGSFVIAPGFDVSFSGNFGNLGGHIMGDRVTLTGSAAARVTGSIVALEPNQLRLGGAAEITIAENPSGKYSGVRFKERFVPVASSYKEIRP